MHTFLLLVYVLCMPSSAAEEPECIFNPEVYKDAVPQTHSDFRSRLDGKPAASGHYVTTVLLNNGEVLIVSSGGCDHISLSATLVVSKSMDTGLLPISNKSYWMGRAKEISRWVPELESETKQLPTKTTKSNPGGFEGFLSWEPGWAGFRVEQTSTTVEVTVFRVVN